MAKKIENVLICGLGAIGTALGEKILTHAPDVLRVLVDSARLQKYSVTPRVLNGTPLEFKYITPDTETAPADLIMISVKSTGLSDAINNIKNFVGANTVIISLLNGVISEELLAKEYGWEKILPAYYIGSSAIRDGSNILHDGSATIVFGAKNDSQSEQVTWVQEFFESVEIGYRVSSDITRAQWTKFMLNVACNQISAILGLTFGDMQTNSTFKELATNVMKEVEACAKAEGVRNTESMIEEVFEHIKTISPYGKTSMLQDVEAGRKTEVDIFAGSVMVFGEKHGIQTPYNTALKLMLETLYAVPHKGQV